MDKLILTPGSVRGFGDIVSPKTVTDYRVHNCKIVEDTDSIGTVYTESYLVGSSIVLDYPRSVNVSAESFSVSGTLKDNSNSVISGASVYLDVNGTVYTGTTNSSGVVSFTVLCDSSSVYYLTGYYLGTNSLAGSFDAGTVYRVDGVDSVELLVEKSLIQTGDSDLFAGIVKYDGEPVRGVTVEFCKEKNTGYLINESPEHRYSPGLYTLFELWDLSSKWELSCDFKPESNSRFLLGSKEGFVDNQTSSVFVGSPNGTNKMYYGYTDTTTHSTDISVEPATYHTIKIAKDGNNFTFTVDGNNYSLSNLTVLDNVTDFVIGVVNEGTIGSVFVKNIKFKVGD